MPTTGRMRNGPSMQTSPVELSCCLLATMPIQVQEVARTLPAATLHLLAPGGAA
jgi:hypothetical protein